MKTAAVHALLAASILLAAPAGGEEPRFTARLSASEITLDQTVELVIEVERDATTPYQGYSRPHLVDFDILHQGERQSTQWTTQGSRQAVRTVDQHVYVLRAKHRGRCSVPPATLHLAGGRELQTQPLSVHVLPAARAPSQSGTAARPGAQPAPSLPSAAAPSGPPTPETMRGDEDIFVEARADRSTVYLGEPAIVSWWLYTQEDILRYRTLVEPKHDDFWSEDLYTPPGTLSWDRAEVKGRPYRAALLLRRALYPLKTGDLSVSRLEAEATTLQTAFYPGGSATRSSRDLVINVLALPAEGRPADFESSNVGQFQIETTLDRSQVAAGEAVTLKVRVHGEGNIRNLNIKKIKQLDGMRVYEPTVSERLARGDSIRGERVLTYLLLPERGGDLTIPALGFSYFDPKLKGYFRVTSSPLALHVTGDPQKVGPQRSDGAKENVLGPRLKPLRIRHHLASRMGERILRGPLLVVFLALPPGILLVVLIVDGMRTLLAKETRGRKRRRARAAARAHLRTAEGYIRWHRPAAFFAECARTLYEHLEYRLGEKCEALTLADLRLLLERRGFAAELAAQLVAELESCDFARFAPAASTPNEMRAASKRVRTLLTAIEQASPMKEVRQ